MNQKELETFAKETMVKDMKTLVGKNKEYSKNDDDALAFFKETADELNISPIQVWYTHYKKHHNSVVNLAKTGNVFSNESIEDRIKDARNYLLILAALINDTTFEVEQVEPKSKGDVING